MGLMCRFFGHKVKVLRTNRWQISTRECCERCGLIRNLESVENSNCVQWVYSDGTRSIGVPHTLEQGIEFGDIS